MDEAQRNAARENGGETGEPSSSGVGSGLHSTAESARDLAHVLERSADTLDRAGRGVEAVSERAEQVERQARAVKDGFRENVRAHPMAAAGAALALGFLIGRS